MKIEDLKLKIYGIARGDGIFKTLCLCAFVAGVIK
jgi:hypothetical protein